jgi:plastocyanin
MALSMTVLIATACAMGSTGPNGAANVSGGASATIVATGSTGTGGGNTGGYGMVRPLSTTYYFDPVPDTVAVGAVVTFQFMDVTHWVTFDQVAAPIANIPPTANADSTRVFSAPGTYTYHCAIHTYMHGTVVAQ